MPVRPVRRQPDVALLVAAVAAGTEIEVQVLHGQRRAGLREHEPRPRRGRHLSHRHTERHRPRAAAIDRHRRLDHHPAAADGVEKATHAAVIERVQPVIVEQIMISNARRAPENEVPRRCGLSALFLVSTKGPINRLAGDGMLPLAALAGPNVVAPRLGVDDAVGDEGPRPVVGVPAPQELSGGAVVDRQGPLLVPAARPLTPELVGSALRGENNRVVAGHCEMKDGRIVMDAASAGVEGDVREVDACLVQNLSGPAVDGGHALHRALARIEILQALGRMPLEIGLHLVGRLLAICVGQRGAAIEPTVADGHPAAPLPRLPRPAELPEHLAGGGINCEDAAELLCLLFVALLRDLPPVRLAVGCLPVVTGGHLIDPAQLHPRGGLDDAGQLARLERDAFPLPLAGAVFALEEVPAKVDGLAGDDEA